MLKILMCSRRLAGGTGIAFCLMCAVLCMALAPVDVRTDDSHMAASDPAWDTLFTRTSGWTGGDVAGTIDLGDGRTLWVFGDTWIGSVADGRHTEGSRLVNTTAALQVDDPASPGKPPETLDFLWGANNAEGEPTTWIPPHAGGKTWFWPTGGGIVVREGEQAPRLYLFLFRLAKSQSESGVWAFQNVGTTLAVFDDIRLPVPRWQPRLFDIPHSLSDTAQEAAGEETSAKETGEAAAAPASAKSRWLAWGTAALTAPDPADHANWLYIFGVRRHSQLQNDAVLARVSPSDLEQFERWQFRADDGQWADQPSACVSVADNVTPEFSVERQEIGGQLQFVMVHSEPIFGPRIFTRLADHVDGAWSPPHPVYRVPDKAGEKQFFAYAAKGHARLSRPGELLVTYVVNSHDFGLMVNDASIYRPRCVRVPLRLIHR